LPARMLDDKGVDCSRISGLLVGRSGPGHDELSARLLLIDLACSRHIGFEGFSDADSIGLSSAILAGQS
jgi:hypothetical protein